MSRKIEKNQSQLSTEAVDNLPVRVDPRMRDGKEVLSSVSRVTVAYLPTMGERIKKYMRTPQLQHQTYHDPELWDDDDTSVIFNEDGSYVSMHEERYQEGLKKAKERKSARLEEEKKQKEEQEKADREAFRAKVKAAIADGES